MVPVNSWDGIGAADGSTPECPEAGGAGAAGPSPGMAVAGARRFPARPAATALLRGVIRLRGGGGNPAARLLTTMKCLVTDS
jgi:hypothetical protein